MASLLSAILFLAVSSSFSHQIVAESARKELRSKLTKQIAPVLSNRIDPSRVVQISWQPRSAGFPSSWIKLDSMAFVLEASYAGFITDEECNHLIYMAHKGTKGDDIFKDKTKATGIMNSSYVKDNVVSVIEERISAWSFLPHQNSRSLQVQHYTSERATGKYDYIGSTSTLEGNEPLMATVILYLSNATHGGELVFPDSAIQKGVNSSGWLKPTKGNAILFFNIHPNTSPDKSSSHERRPLVNGELWCAVKLLYMRPIITEDLSAGSDDGECTDQDDDCPQWATRGECERNPVYMVGSPDYYGTCRKSCKVC